MIARGVRTGVLWVLAGVVMLPLMMTLSASLMGKPELAEHIGPVLKGGMGQARMPLLPSLPTVEQYLKLLLDNTKFLTMFWNSISIALPLVMGQVLVGALAAWGFARFRFPGRDVLFMGYIALMMMPFQVTLAPTFLVLDRLGLVDTSWAIILPGIFSTFAVFLLRQFFRSIPAALMESARIDGAGELTVFGRIAFPLGMPGIVSLFILSFLDTWNLIEQPMTFLRTQAGWPLSLYLTRIGETNVDVAMAASILTLIPTLLLFFYCQSYLQQGIQMSGIKG
ncbi:MAG: carbohydrate ABC transporter permease [Clostridia bacterium]|nr:carbohydrate ABC transporter permease [Clostridia bacterium]